MCVYRNMLPLCASNAPCTILPRLPVGFLSFEHQVLDGGVQQIKYVREQVRCFWNGLSQMQATTLLLISGKDCPVMESWQASLDECPSRLQNTNS